MSTLNASLILSEKNEGSMVQTCRNNVNVVNIDISSVASSAQVKIQFQPFFFFFFFCFLAVGSTREGLSIDVSITTVLLILKKLE